MISIQLFDAQKILKLFFCSLIVLFCSCSNNDSDDDQEVTDELHLSFKTPEWERYINCEHLDLFPEERNNTTYAVFASSESTRETFVFSYPKDSSEIVKTKALSKYKIMEFGANNEPFQFSQKLPLNAESIDNTSKRLVSAGGFSDTEYNQVLEVKYLKSEPDYTVFRVKCKYEMKAYVTSDPENKINITGTFAFKIRTTKN